MGRFCKLRQKEVVNCIDGCILGFVCDLIIDECEGAIEAIVVPKPGRLFVWGKGDRDIVIPWCKIEKIGKDVIIVRLDGEGPHHHHKFPK